MLKHIDDCLPQFVYIGDTDIIKTRIICYASCYGFDKPYLDFWFGDGVIISRFDGVLTVWADEKADYPELREFLDIMGAVDIITFSFVADKLNYSNYTVKRSFEFFGVNENCPIVSQIPDNYMREAYRLITRSIPDSFKDDENSYLSFLSDYRYRENRGFARGYCIVDNENLRAVGFTAAETDSAAILSGIACHQDFRNCGYGKKIVVSLASNIISEGKRAFVIALNDSAVGFYKHIGFKEKENIAYISL